jgi:hypothetical protein
MATSETSADEAMFSGMGEFSGSGAEGDRRINVQVGIPPPVRMVVR